MDVLSPAITKQSKKRTSPTCSEQEEETTRLRKKRCGAYMQAMFAGKDQNAQTPDDLYENFEKEFGKFGKDMCPNNPDFDGLSQETVWPDKTYLNVSTSKEGLAVPPSLLGGDW